MTEFENDNDDNLLKVDDCSAATTAIQLPETTHETPVNDPKNDRVMNNNNDKSCKARKEEEKDKQARILQSFGTRIDPTILRAFKSFVFNKHGRLNRVFSVEIENAFTHYITCGRNQHHDANYTFEPKAAARHRSDVQVKLTVIARQLLQNHEQYPFFSPDSIKKIIWDVIGRNVDKRTFNKYLLIIKRQCTEKQSNYGITSSFDVSEFCGHLLGISYEDTNKAEVDDRENV